MPNLISTLVTFCCLGFFPLNENKWSVTEQMCKAAEYMLDTRAWEPVFGSLSTPLEASLASGAGEALGCTWISCASPLFQHDQFADTLPVSEQEFIFIRLCVLREVRCSSCCSCWLLIPFKPHAVFSELLLLCVYCSTWRENSPWPACLSLLILKGVLMTGSSCASLWGMTFSLICHLWRSGRRESVCFSCKNSSCFSLPGVSLCGFCLGREQLIAWLTSIKTSCTKLG